jgi:hypothetical protein
MGKPNKRCEVEGCDNWTSRARFCDKHHRRWKRHGDPTKKLVNKWPDETRCYLDGCDSLAKVLLKTDTPMCHKHYARFKRHGDPAFRKTRKRGEGSIKNGYVYVQVEGKKVGQHRLVMENYLGRKLEPDERVHHKNGVRSDNAKTNLELWTTAHPSGQRVADLLVWARQLLDRYEGYADPA